MRKPVWNVIHWGLSGTLGVVVPLLAVLSLTIPVFCVFCHLIRSGFCAEGAVQSHLHSSAGLLLWGLFSTRVWGMAAKLGGTFFSASSFLITVGAPVGGISQDALTLNKFVEAGMVLGHGVSSLFCGAVAVIAASGCCLS